MVVKHLPAWLRLKACSMRRRSHLKALLFELDAERLPQDLDGVGIGMQGAGNGGDQVLVFGEALQRLFDDGLAGAGNAEDEAESTLLTMDLEGVVNLPLRRQ